MDTLQTTHLILGSWTAEVESDNSRSIEFLNNHFKQGAVDRCLAVLAPPRVRITFRAQSPNTDAFSRNRFIADDTLEVNEAPGEVQFATPLIRARAIREGGRVQAN